MCEGVENKIREKKKEKKRNQNLQVVRNVFLKYNIFNNVSWWSQVPEIGIGHITGKRGMAWYI